MMMNDEDVATKLNDFATFQRKTIHSVAFYHLLQSTTCLVSVIEPQRETDGGLRWPRSIN